MQPLLKDQQTPILQIHLNGFFQGFGERVYQGIQKTALAVSSSRGESHKRNRKAKVVNDYENITEQIRTGVV